MTDSNVDYGLIQTAPDHQIWMAEVEKDAGARTYLHWLEQSCDCDDPTSCNQTRFQGTLAALTADEVKEFFAELAVHEKSNYRRITKVFETLQHLFQARMRLQDLRPGIRREDRRENKVHQAQGGISELIQALGGRVH